MRAERAVLLATVEDGQRPSVPTTPAARCAHLHASPNPSPPPPRCNRRPPRAAARVIAIDRNSPDVDRRPAVQPAHPHGVGHLRRHPEPPVLPARPLTGHEPTVSLDAQSTFGYLYCDFSLLPINFTQVVQPRGESAFWAAHCPATHLCKAQRYGKWLPLNRTREHEELNAYGLPVNRTVQVWATSHPGGVPAPSHLYGGPSEAPKSTKAGRGLAGLAGLWAS